MSAYFHLAVLSCLLCLVEYSVPDPRRWPLEHGPSPQIRLAPRHSDGARVGLRDGSLPSRVDCSRLTPLCHHRPRSRIPEAPFVRHPVLFDVNSHELPRGTRSVLAASVLWLELHPNVRVLVVGTCDSSGSEVCTRDLALARGLAVRDMLDAAGIDPRQLVAVRAWNSSDQPCRHGPAGCQQQDRSAWIFVASPIAQ